MRKVFYLIAVLFPIFTSCIVEEYDLSKVESGLTIGSSTSEFHMPLVKIDFTISSLHHNMGSEDMSLEDIFKEVDIWLPSSLPGGCEYLDIENLNNQEYFSSIVRGLVEQMQVDSKKRVEVFTLIGRKYMEDFIDNLPYNFPVSIKSILMNSSKEQVSALLEKFYAQYGQMFTESISCLSNKYLKDITLDDVVCEIPHTTISQDLLDLIIENLDASDVKEPVHVLYLHGDIHSELPIELAITPVIENTHTIFDTIVVAKGESEIGKTRIFREDIDKFFGGAVFRMPVALKKYYPNMEININQHINISLHLHKTGSLSNKK